MTAEQQSCFGNDAILHFEKKNQKKDQEKVAMLKRLYIHI